MSPEFFSVTPGSNSNESNVSIVLILPDVSSVPNVSNYTDDLDYPSLEAFGKPMQAVLVTLYTLTAILALFGNITVIFVLTTGKRSSRELRVFLINLAISDITMAVFSIPFTYTTFMLGRWIFHPLFCPFVNFMQHCSVMVSVYTLTAIGVDRYYAIMYPFRSRWTKSRGPVILFLIWLISVVLSSVQLIHGRVDEFTWAGQDYLECKEVWDETDGKIYTAVIFLITFLVPMLILTFTYSSVGWKMWRHTSPGNADPTRDQHQLMAKLKVVKMLATVVFLFAICWLPIHILNLLIYFHKEIVTANHDRDFVVYHATFFTCHWLSMSNSFINPVIYCFMSDNFRVDLKQLVFCYRKRKPKSREKLTTVGLSSSCSSFRTTTSVLNCSSQLHPQVTCPKSQSGSQVKPLRFYRVQNGNNFDSDEF